MVAPQAIPALSLRPGSAKSILGRTPHPLLMVAQRDDLLAGCRVPEARRPVTRGGDDAHTVGGRRMHSAPTSHGRVAR